MLTGIDIHGVLTAGESLSLGKTVGWSSGGRKHTQGQEASEGLEGNHCASWPDENNEVKISVMCGLAAVGKLGRVRLVKGV